jgi:alkylation response protein AidB-like acyl-CoA dehydrogenase
MIVSTRAAASLELKHELKTEARTWQVRAREFAEEVIQPLGQALDRMDAQAAVAPGSPVYDLLAQAHREGYTRLTDSPQRGGIGLSHGAEYLVLEELARADAGLAALLITAPLPFRWAGAASFGRLARSLSLPYFRLERLDWSGCYAPFEHGGLRAAPADGGWLLAGSTGLVLGAATATHAALSCAIDAGAPGGEALAIVPLDRPGVRRGPAADRPGLRTQARARLTLDGVRLGNEELLIPPRTSAGLVGAACALGHVTHAIAAVGLGRAAYEGVLRLVRERSYYGAVTELDQAERRLFELYTLLEAARATTRAAHRHTWSGSPSDAIESLRQATAAHAFAADTVCAVVNGAFDLCSQWTDARGEVEYVDGSIFCPEKLLRDARSHRVGRPDGGSHGLLATLNP